MRSTARSLACAGSMALLCVAFGACGSSNKGLPGGSGFGTEGGTTGGDGGPGFGDDGPGGKNAPTCDAGCPMGTTCDYGVCLPPQAACVTNGDCEDDTYCSNGQCVPYGSAPMNMTNDPTCSQAVSPGAFAPTVFCEFATAPANDPFPTFLDVQATPIVDAFDKATEGAAAIPSSIAPFTATVPG